MNAKIKDLLGLAMIISILVAAYSAYWYVKTYDKSILPSSFRSFSVSAEGRAVAIPDVGKFSFSVITQGGTDLTDLQKKNIEKTNQAIEFIKSKGVEAKDIKTEGYNIEPRYQTFSCPHLAGEVKPCPPPEIVGYLITQTISVKVRDLSKTGEIVSGVVQKGANSVSSLSFATDDLTSVQAKARTEAIQKAKEKAKTIAEAAGFRVGRLLSIEEGASLIPQPRFNMEMMTAAETPSLPTIEAGSQEITVNVTLRYEIE